VTDVDDQIAGGDGYRLRSVGAWLPPLLALAGLVALTVGRADRAAFIAVNHLGPATSDTLWANITILGDAVVAAALCLPLWRRRPDLLWALVMSALVATAWVHLLKPVVNAPRPLAILGEAVHVIGGSYRWRSFPSGHATTLFLVAGLVILGIRSRAVATLASALALAGALSRSVVGAHWPSDLLGGLIGGWLSAACGLAVARRSLAFGTRAVVQGVIGALLAACALALLFGYRTGYPQALAFQRVLGAACLASAVLTYRWRSRG
jgi:membrane-associated phospholipid phosphatase